MIPQNIINKIQNMRIQNQNMRTNNLIHLINKWHFFLMSGDYYRLNGLKRQINQM